MRKTAAECKGMHYLPPGMGNSYKFIFFCHHIGQVGSLAAVFLPLHAIVERQIQVGEDIRAVPLPADDVTIRRDFAWISAPLPTSTTPGISAAAVLLTTS